MQASSEAAPRRVMWLLLLATLLVGLAHIAFLPPFEGFDETAHWSYVQELSDLGHPPRYDHDTLSADTDRYPGPMAYSGSEPFEHTGRPTYRSFDKAGAPAIGAGPTRYRGDGSLNWQAQHPPLYYALMVPVYRASQALGWVDGVMALRLASYLLAFTGFAIGVVATARWAEAETGPGAWTGPIMAAWPFLFPQFFPEFARMGNDSLCILFMGVSWAALLRLLSGRGDWASATALGIALGLGLLTKAFFVPIGAAAGLLLLLRWNAQGRPMRQLAQAVAAGLIALAIGGWWYVMKKLETGSLTGSDEFIKLQRSGGLSLIAQGFSPGELARGLAVIVGTFLWAGTWSLARLPEWSLAAPFALMVVALAEYLRRAGRYRVIGWAPLAFAAPMAAGLVYHVFVWMAGTSAVTPGWYFHILAAPLGLAVAIGWRRPRVLGALAAVTAIYTAVAWAMQLSMFSGCAAKLGDDKHYSFEGAACFIDPHALAAIGHPRLGAVSLALGIASGLAAAALALLAFRPAQADTAEPAELAPLQPL